MSGRRPEVQRLHDHLLLRDLGLPLSLRPHRPRAPGRRPRRRGRLGCALRAVLARPGPRRGGPNPTCGTSPRRTPGCSPCRPARSYATLHPIGSSRCTGLFAARHVDGGQLREPEVVRDVLTGAGLDVVTLRQPLSARRYCGLRDVTQKPRGAADDFSQLRSGELSAPPYLTVRRLRRLSQPFAPRSKLVTCRLSDPPPSNALQIICARLAARYGLASRSTPGSSRP